jgi:hypothetical protein
VTKEEARTAYEAGFNHSAEGWNAEYPFGSNSLYACAHRKEHNLTFDQDFEAWWAQQEKKS